MSLRLIAEQDLQSIIETDLTGFGWPITVTSPAGATYALRGFSNDIGQVIDPDTGQVVSGRSASVAIRIGLLIENGLAVMQNISDTALKPWLVTFDDINGVSATFKVIQSNPDRALGLLTCLLSFYDS